MTQHASASDAGDNAVPDNSVPGIELQHITLTAGAFSLRDLSLRIPLGEYAVLMGPSGQGKTTILEIICGLRKIEAGSVRISGVDVTVWSPADRQIGYVPQDLALFPTMTVRENLEFALKLRKARREIITQRIDELATLLGIGYLLKRGVRHLSGGEAQRVALGRALSFHPSLLLLDEPLSALDEDRRHEMQHLLRGVQQQTGVTTLHVTHSMEEAENLADRVLTLRNGTVASHAGAQAHPRGPHLNAKAQAS